MMAVLSLKRLVLILIQVFLLASPTYAAAKPSAAKKTAYTHDVSIGFLSHKVGHSLVSYTRSLWSSKNHELYAGVGTLLVLNTAALGWKSYLMRDFVDIYIVGAALVMAGMSEDLFGGPFLSTGIEVGFWDGFFANAGANGIVRITFKDDAFDDHPDVIIFGQGSLGYRW